MALWRLGLEPRWSYRIRIEPKWLREFCLYNDMPFIAGKPPRSPHDWLCKSCVTSSDYPCRNTGFRRECHRCHLAFKVRSEKREPPAKSTKESARVAALEKEVEQLRQAAKKSEESTQQETDAPSKAAYTSGSGLARGTELLLPAQRSHLRTLVLAVFCTVSYHLPRWCLEWDSSQLGLNVVWYRFSIDATQVRSKHCNNWCAFSTSALDLESYRGLPVTTVCSWLFFTKREHHRHVFSKFEKCVVEPTSRCHDISRLSPLVTFPHVLDRSHAPSKSNERSSIGKPWSTSLFSNVVHDPRQYSCNAFDATPCHMAVPAEEPWSLTSARRRHQDKYKKHYGRWYISWGKTEATRRHERQTTLQLLHGCRGLATERATPSLSRQPQGCTREAEIWLSCGWFVLQPRRLVSDEATVRVPAGRTAALPNQELNWGGRRETPLEMTTRARRRPECLLDANPSDPSGPGSWHLTRSLHALGPAFRAFGATLPPHVS